MTGAWLGGAKTPPYSVHQEKAVLGGLLCHPEQFDAVVPMLDAGDVFFRSQHGLIWAAMGRAWAGAAERTADAIATALEESGKLETIGGRKYLASLAELVTNPAMTLAAARQVRDKARLRRLIDATSEILAEAYAGEHDVDALLTRARARFDALDPAAPAPPRAPRARKKTTRKQAPKKPE